MTLALLSVFLWLRAQGTQPNSLLVQSADIRQQNRESFERTTEKLGARVAPIVKNINDYFDQKKYDVAETACWQMYSVLSPAPFMQAEALDALADVQQAEGKDREALNYWLKTYTTSGEGTLADIAVSYANLGLADQSQKYIQRWLDANPHLTQLDIDDLPFEDRPSNDNLKATALLLRTLSLGGYGAGSPNLRKIQDLRGAYELAPRNGNICFWLGRVTPDGPNEYIRLYKEAFKYGGPVIKNISGRILTQLGEKLPGS